jgi:hypothetical protein
MPLNRRQRGGPELQLLGGTEHLSRGERHAAKPVQELDWIGGHPVKTDEKNQGGQAGI